MKQRLLNIQENIERSCELVRRNPAEINLIAVSKTFSTEDILKAYDLGIRHFGESRLQELELKVPSLPNDIIWHFVGKVQSNKAQKVGDLASVVHSIESVKQLNQFEKCIRTFDGLIQVNIAKEQQKSGIFLERVDETVLSVLKYKKVRFRGLMTIGKIVENHEESRPYFRKLVQEAKRINADWISMGMSKDYEIAVQEGATHIRVGKALFGERT